jgi:ATP-dependent RNA helicase DHX8/PRP22
MGGCIEEMLSVTALLSAENVWLRPSEQRERVEAEEAHAKLASPHGDHLTLLKLYDAWRQAGKSTSFCHEHYVHARALKQAIEFFFC